MPNNKKIICPNCDGEKTVEGNNCSECKGTGQVQAIEIKQTTITGGRKMVRRSK